MICAFFVIGASRRRPTRASVLGIDSERAGHSEADREELRSVVVSVSFAAIGSELLLTASLYFS